MKRRVAGLVALVALFAVGIAFAAGGTPTTQTYTYTVPGTTIAIPDQTYTQTITVPTVTETTTQTVTVTDPGTTTTTPTTTATPPGTPLPTDVIHARTNNYSSSEGGKSFYWVQYTSPTTSALDQQDGLPRLIDASQQDSYWYIWQQKFDVLYTGPGPYSASKCQFMDFQVPTLAVEGGSSDPHGGWADAGPSFLGLEYCERAGTGGIRVGTTEYPLPDPCTNCWQTYVMHVVWGRNDGTTPDPGSVELWRDGSEIFNVSDVDTLKHHIDGTPEHIVRLDEGYYITPGYATETPPISWSNGPALVVNPNAPDSWDTEHTATQIGATYQEALADTDLTPRFSYPGVGSTVVPGMTGSNSNATSAPTQRTTADLVLPNINP